MNSLIKTQSAELLNYGFFEAVLPYTTNIHPYEDSYKIEIYIEDSRKVNLSWESITAHLKEPGELCQTPVYGKYYTESHIIHEEYLYSTIKITGVFREPAIGEYLYNHFKEKQ